ncbi:MAG TPA: WhiB family transcriptional regulator, partial [Arthrobacter bacterium]|nr:WhiB family transcriptional regulator [Arthrobacter sp.]
MGQVERIHEDAVVAGQATAKYRARGVPSDWYVDPADPDAADRY